MNLFNLETKKIPCYVLVYKEIDIVKKSLDFFTSLDMYLDIIVIENPSENTKKISNYINKLGLEKKISKYYLFDENISNNAYDIVITKELSNIKRNKFVIISDGDVTVENPLAWLKETKRILKYNKSIFSCGAQLDPSNLPIKTFPEANTWVPPLLSKKRIHEGLTGCHLLMFRGYELESFMKWKNKNKSFFVDGELHKFCYDILNKRWARTVKSMAYHLTWDLYMDLTHEYTKMKTSKSFHDTWYHQKISDYSVKYY